MRYGFILWILSFGIAHAQTDVGPVLDALAASCRRLYVSGYAVDIERTLDQHLRFAEHPGPLPPIFKNTVHMFLAHSGNRARFDRKQDSLHWELLTDGTTEWAWRRDLRMCIEKPAQPWPERLGPGEGVPHEEWRYLTKFLAAGTMAGKARLLRDDVPPDQVCDGPSVIVVIDLGREEEGHMTRIEGTEELRILTRSYLPCHAVSKRIYRLRQLSEITETITWRFREVTDEMFTPPPAKVKRVKKFPPPPSPEGAFPQ